MAAFAEMGVAPALISAIEDQGWQCVLPLEFYLEKEEIRPSLQAMAVRCQVHPHISKHAWACEQHLKKG